MFSAITALLFLLCLSYVEFIYRRKNPNSWLTRLLIKMPWWGRAIVYFVTLLATTPIGRLVVIAIVLSIMHFKEVKNFLKR